MSTVEQAESAPVEFNEDSIAEYLQAHPDFFTRHTDLLADLDGALRGAGLAGIA